MLRMLGLSILMIVAFTAAVGGFLFGAMRPSNQPLGAIVGVAGAALGAWSLWRLIVLNRAFQRQAYEQVLAQPERILARWDDPLGAVILAKDALFVDESYHPYRSWYCNLIALRHEEGRLIFTFRRGAANRHFTGDIAVTLPAEASSTALEGLRERGLLGE